MKNWFKKRRSKLISDVARETVRQLQSSCGFQKFLPPVVLNGAVYLVTEDGTIYRMTQDPTREMEIISRIKVM